MVVHTLIALLLTLFITVPKKFKFFVEVNRSHRFNTYTKRCTCNREEEKKHGCFHVCGVSEFYESQSPCESLRALPKSNIKTALMSKPDGKRGRGERKNRQESESG